MSNDVQDISNEDVVAKNEQQALIQDIEESQRLKDLMSTSNGKYLIKLLLISSGMFNMTGSQLNTNTVMFNQGKREVGIHLYNLCMQADKNLFLTILKEINDE